MGARVGNWYFVEGWYAKGWGLGSVGELRNLLFLAELRFLIGRVDGGFFRSR